MPKVNHFVNSVFNHSSRLPTTLGKHFGMKNLGAIRMGLAGVGAGLVSAGALYGGYSAYKGIRHGSPTSYAKGIFGGGALAALGMGLGHGSARALMRSRGVRKMMPGIRGARELGGYRRFRK